ncbi:MAG: hypothetical protein LBK99_14290 [Opitutaceae bacterium]|nr:hypothetical protein [Opitutaceae bacterium]
MNRIIGVTDTGYRERQESQLAEESRERAKLRVALPDNVQRLLGEYYHLSRIGADARTVQQTQRYMKLSRWRNITYKPAEDLLWKKYETNGGRWNKGLLRQLEGASAGMERK